MFIKKERWMVVGLWFALIVGLMTASSINVFTQSDNSQISGFAKDQAGAVVAGAKITVKNQTREFQRTTTTNAEGYYVVPNLPPGLYTITIEATGFKLSQTTDKKLDPNIAANADFTLVPGQVTETVNVTASTASVQTETATVGKLVEGKQIQMLQLNGRNPLYLAQLKPGVAGNAMGGFNFGLTTGGLNINGSRTQDNLITIDGAVGVRTRSNGTSIGVADLDSTQEVQILTANYNAEYGRAAGGQIRMVTKSGGRDFHGNFYEYLRNSAFNANEWGRNASAPANQPCSDPRFENAAHCRPNPFRYNQFGYNLSGPVIIPGTGINRGRDKLFFLWGQEWLRDRRSVNRTLVVPTLKMRQGDFSELATANRFYTSPIFIPDPNKTGMVCNATNQSGCFSDGGIINKIPADQLSANGLGLLRAFPEPIPGFSGPGGANWFAERPLTTDQRKDTVSIDFYPNDKHQLRWRMQLYNFLENNPFPFTNEPGLTPRIFDRPNQTTSINWVWTISPNWISETLVAGSRDQVFIGVDSSADLLRRSRYGINYPFIFPDRKEIPDKIPTVDGLSPFAILDGGPYPSQSTGPIYQFSNNLTNIRGSHTIKFGAYFERAGQNDFDQINVAGTPGGTNNQNGRFAFVDGRNGNQIVTPSIVNAALGNFNTYAEVGPRSFTPYRGHMFEWFAQDAWKVTPKLRLEYGLRHTIIQPYYSLWGNMALFDERYYDPNNVVKQDPLTGFITDGDMRARYNGIVIPGDGLPSAAAGRIVLDPDLSFLFRGDPKQYSEIHKNTFQPRFGIAYAINDKTVIRAGAGRFMTRLGVSDSVFLGGNPPLQPTASVSNGKVDSPGGRVSNAFPLVITTQDRIFKNPESWAWSATFQRELAFNTTIEVGYVGRRGLHGQRERNINQLPINTCPNNTCPVIPGDTRNRRYNADFLRPYEGLSIIRVTNNDANATYHSFQVGVDRRFTNSLSFGVAYTLSKALDDGSAQRFVIPNANDASTLWGPADYDRRHVLVLNAIYEFPFFKNQAKLTGKFLGGWSISAMSQFQTGTPFSITAGDDPAGVGPGSGRQFYVIQGDPQLNHQFSSNLTDSNNWFSVTAVAPAPGTFSNQKFRNFIYGPGFQNHNIGIFKTFSLTERHRIQFRAEAFNWLNHPNWGGANGTNTYDPNSGMAGSGIGLNPLSANFGKVTTKGSERQLQFALRYQF
jgi:carboxypeptidase family protein